MRIIQIVAGALFIIAGGLIFQVHADNEFIHLTPSEGAAFRVPIQSDKVFEQTFVVQGQELSKIGAFLLPIHTKAKTSSGVIHIEVLRGTEVKASGDVPVSRIDSDGASLVRLSPSLPTTKGESLTMRIMSSPDASGFIALQKRTFDESFPDRDISFAIDGLQQDYPIAYSVFERIWPPFTAQLGGLLMMAGVVLLFWNIAVRAKTATTLVVLIFVALLYAIPSFDTHRTFYFLTVILLCASWLLLRIAGRTILASLFGAFIFSCSTWLPLFLITGGTVDGILPIRDALIDPNQISVSHGAGGYVGIPGALFAVAGVCIWITMIVQKRFTLAHLESVMAILFAVSIFMTFAPGPLQHSKAIILVVGCIAWFASLSLDRMQRFLGVRDMFVQTLMAIFLCIALLDLMHITARTFTYGLGI